MKKPPDAVKKVMEAVCIMMGVKPDKIKDPDGGNKKIDDYWGPAQKQLLGDARFLQNLMEFDKDHMDPRVVEAVSVYTANPDFDPTIVMKGSVAAAGLCKWVHAMVKYDRVAKIVAPKRAALEGAEKALAAAMANLAEKQAVLQEVLNKLDALNRNLKEAEDKKKNLQDQVTDCANKLRRAKQLINGLGGERTRWTELSQVLQVSSTRTEPSSSCSCPHDCVAVAAERLCVCLTWSVVGLFGSDAVRERDGRHHAVLRRHRLPGLLHQRLPRVGDPAVERAAQGQAHPQLRRVQPQCHTGRARQDPVVGHRQAAQRQLLDRQRHHALQEQPLAAHDRPAGAGQPLGEEAGGGRQPQGGQAEPGQLRSHHRELDPVRQSGAARERGRVARPHPRVRAAQADRHRRR